jgi:glucose/arabinose dehydrogenase
MRGLAVLAIVVLSATFAVGAAAQGSASPRLVTVVRNLSSPVFVTQAPGEAKRLYVVEQGGRVRVVESGRVKATLLDITSLTKESGEQGLLGLAFAPGYPRTPFVYVNYTASADGATTIARFRVVRGRAVPASRTTLLTVAQPYANHNGGNLAFGRDGRLWVGLGDGGSGGDPENRAQDPSTLLGKLFTLDVRQASPQPALAAIGLRNPWRYSFDRATGDLWIGDVGQNAVEEVDVLRAGTTGLVNFGWDVLEGNARYEDKPFGPGTRIDPVATYSHAVGCSVTGGYVYRGKAVTSLRGRYLYGDYCQGTIWSLATRGGQPRVEPFSVPEIVSFGESLAGELYAVSHQGTIYRIAR